MRTQSISKVRSRRRGQWMSMLSRRPGFGRGLIATVLAAVVVAMISRWVAGLDELHGLLTYGIIGLGAAATILADISGRLSGDRRMTWISSALALYTLVVVPSMTLWSGEGEVVQATRLTGLSAATVLLLVAVRPPAQLGTWGAWLAAAGGLATTVAVAHGVAVFPVVLTVPSMVVPTDGLVVAVLVAWCAVAVFLAATEVIRGNPAMCRVGSGLLLVACAHIEHVMIGIDTYRLDLAFDAARLLGLLLVLAGALQLVCRAIRVVRTERWRLEEDLRIAVTHVHHVDARAAERDHELRNGLSALSGVTELLTSTDGGPDREWLRSAVLRELVRLAAMVDGAGHPAAEGGYDVGRVVTDAVGLRAVTGARITLDCPHGLRARGSADVLVQVITNLLANCGRHAPGAPVVIRCGPVGERIVIQISDDGPGLPPGFAAMATARGVRSSSTGGEGIGLYICSTLLAGEGGHLRLLPAERGRGGCTAVVELRRVDGTSDVEPAGHADLVSSSSALGSLDPGPGMASVLHVARELG